MVLDMLHVVMLFNLKAAVVVERIFGKSTLQVKLCFVGFFCLFWCWFFSWLFFSFY